MEGRGGTRKRAGGGEKRQGIGNPVKYCREGKRRRESRREKCEVEGGVRGKERWEE